jgi:hypothetical protein
MKVTRRLSLSTRILGTVGSIRLASGKVLESAEAQAYTRRSSEHHDELGIVPACMKGALPNSFDERHGAYKASHPSPSNRVHEASTRHERLGGLGRAAESNASDALTLMSQCSRD